MMAWVLAGSVAFGFGVYTWEIFSGEDIAAIVVAD
jgi:hypothetical protein